jgi:hypothetical protein
MPVYSPSSSSLGFEVLAKVYATSLTLTLPPGITEETDFVASGVLTYLRGATPMPLPNRTVNVEVRDAGGAVVAQTDAVTNSGGVYAVTMNILLAGAYTIIASFSGASGLSEAVAWADASIGGQALEASPLAVVAAAAILFYLFL